MSLHVTAIMLGVADLARSKQFYGEGLGCAIDKDYPVIRAAVFVIGIISLLTTLVIDIVLGIIDPRTLGEQRG